MKPLEHRRVGRRDLFSFGPPSSSTYNDIPLLTFNTDPVGTERTLERKRREEREREKARESVGKVEGKKSKKKSHQFSI